MVREENDQSVHEPRYYLVSRASLALFPFGFKSSLAADQHTIRVVARQDSSFVLRYLFSTTGDGCKLLCEVEVMHFEGMHLALLVTVSAVQLSLKLICT